jgi:hypothetical protein
MKKYPSIGQFREVVKGVRLTHDFQGKDSEGEPIYEHKSRYPILKFRGTTKIHGTNASVVKYADGRLEYQSRERILSIAQDNSNFMMEMMQKNLSFLFDGVVFTDYCAVYGEWCGGDIQKGVAINELPKMFVIFGVKVDNKWIELNPELQDNNQRIYNILQFGTYDIDIDFDDTSAAQDLMIKLTEEVENCCPVGKFFGVEGVGEGIVFTCVDNPNIKFKSKGEKHSVTKVKKLNSPVPESYEEVINFVESVVTENRLQQGITYFKENMIDIDIKNTGKFLSWITLDILKEEEDTIVTNNLNVNKVKKTIAEKARRWFINSTFLILLFFAIPTNAQTYNFSVRKDVFCGLEMPETLTTSKVVLSSNSAVWYDVSNHKIIGPFKFNYTLDGEYNVYINDEMDALVMSLLGDKAIIIIGWTGSGNWLNKTVLTNEFTD